MQKYKWVSVILCMMMVLLSLAGCGSSGSSGDRSLSASSEMSPQQSAETYEPQSDAAVAAYQPPEIGGSLPEREMKTVAAKGFRIFYYPDGSRLFHLRDGENYLMPAANAEHHPASESAAGRISSAEEEPALEMDQGEERNKVAEFSETGFIILPSSPHRIYLAASACMALFSSADALDTVAFTGTRQEDWTIPAAVTWMKAGKIVYAGKYSAPDYELLTDQKCDLAIENTMIWHTPAVREKLAALGIPVLVDYSSYESNPEGRLEWIRLYGELSGHPAEAEQFWQQESQKIEAVSALPATGRTAAVFSLDSAGRVITRRSSDYIPAMIRMAGGTYIPGNLEKTDDSGSGSVILTAEEYYAEAKDADILIYNAAIEKAPRRVAELVQQNHAFSNFRAVRSGEVYAADSSLYQATDAAAEIIEDLHSLLAGETDRQLIFFHQLNPQ